MLTDADTDTPCIYDTVLHINVPRVHSESGFFFLNNSKKKKNFKLNLHREHNGNVIIVSKEKKYLNSTRQEISSNASMTPI